ncbi:replicative DNA helicase [Cellulosilyticum sp. ST5]|uniref:Replicative DNA helicase n=1 Tax=Cellulosilyticum lentocellum (strain ATCC 49066 / DSM 5427 / NCIMB 11756 / RHM5) TaxID=642492 RepID=F2JRZ3_CELLD|nr:MULTISPECIES: replicative DNA helicase [Cellulosilyticum]ADZ82807.1 replicative DNA helicase [Cellulosilyticum lentocellum DSM 5427]QEH68349.1 replicative DNA helicase [Cellulosilyticum sp. WCF-2]
MEQIQNMRIPPHSIEAEQSVIGSMIMDHDAVIVASEILRPDDFYRPDHAQIYAAIMELYTTGNPIDLITIQDKLVQKGVLEQIGGLSYIAELASSVPTSAHIKQYAKIVEEKATLRRLIKASNEISAKSFEGEEPLDNIMGFAEKQIFEILQNKKTEDFTGIDEIVLTSIEKIEEAHKSQGGITGIETGFIDLDHRTAGLQPSDLVLVAARPSMGKTAFALNIIQTAGIKNKKSVAVFSLEMSKDQLVSRMLCAEAMVDSQKARTGALEKDDWDKLAQSIPNIANSRIFIDDTAGINVMEMRAKCRRLKMEKGLDLIMIDYLQLMSGTGDGSSRQQEISDISRSLKALAREMNAPVIALSQLSRACETRTDHRPMLSDLRESGAIEQDADVVMFLYRDEYYHPDTEKKNVGEVIIAKQRNGPTGTVELVWLGQYTKFANMQH